ncbi:hypothetical protein COT48_01380 [Candidatus Woesearchaeota archaeon CG08_land_8_20_14_0_20_47_9]|nr:MAG: hypothetical protein AUJ69_00680 [Candidatus Woesearchaeota archaeon CG1_02_47_18]PIN72926.1 MAG: hypothetical protein COV22_01920 [Candidatus Woesearchaeota archaeon CG10_big_fil_rev_8_21_14_0_10_47_5]PIO04246.1 MAG: hypothetical protein COT48_01380 [Candidatus Woesearchaeota archaeon CG08_land_8_20_14_0_20_47_9]
MGILDKLMFWKKGDDLGLDTELGLDEKGMPRDNLSSFSDAARKQPSQPAPNQGHYPEASEAFNTQPAEGFERMQMQGFPPEGFQHAPSTPPNRGYEQYVLSKELEVISSKLDAIRATLENINQRIANLERIAYGEDDHRRRAW